MNVRSMLHIVFAVIRGDEKGDAFIAGICFVFVELLLK